MTEDESAERERDNIEGDEGDEQGEDERGILQELLARGPYGPDEQAGKA